MATYTSTNRGEIVITHLAAAFSFVINLFSVNRIGKTQSLKYAHREVKITLHEIKKHEKEPMKKNS